MKRTIALSALVTVISAGALAHAETLTPTHDTFIKTDGSGPYGSSATINTKFALTSLTNNRYGLVRFSHSSTAPVSEASLELTVANFSTTLLGSNTAHIAVWGIVDGWGCGEAFNEDNATDATLSAVLTSYVVDPSSACLYDGNANTEDKQPLGHITVDQSQVGQTISFTSDALVKFIEANRNGRITFLLEQELDIDSPVTKFASKEHTSLAPPTLHVEHVGVLELANLPAGSTQNPDGSWHFEGDLPIPVAGGLSVTAPDAIVDMTFDGNGELATITGTVALPELPASGLWNGLGPMTSTANYVQIGYDYPANFVPSEMNIPIDETLRYFHFVEQSGASVEWGHVSAETPNAGATLLALDPKSPSVFFYSDQLFGDSGLEALSVGISGGNNIAFEPAYEAGVEAQMTSFDGDAYLGGTLSFDTSIPGVEISVTGGATVDVDDAKFVSGLGSGWIKDLGINGDVYLELGFTPFTLSYWLGGGTFRYANRSNDWIAFSGIIDPDDIHGLPAKPKGYAQIAGYVTQNLTNSFIDIEGELQFGTSFAQQKIEASLHIAHDPNGWYGELEGSAKFVGTKVDVYGSVHPGYAVFSGSITHKWDFAIGKVEAIVGASFDSRNTEVDLNAKLKFCGAGSCDSVGGSVSLNGSGQIRVCANVPGYGTTCDTLG